LGPEYKPNHQRLEIDLTYACNLHCHNCNRSCAQAPSNEQIDVRQIKRLIEESIGQKKKWQRIRLLGGEPTLHPQLLETIELLLSYKRNFSPGTEIEISTNGFGPQVEAVLKTLPNEVKIRNTRKTAAFNNGFYTFNIAPIDLKIFDNVDYSNACSVASSDGIGLNMYGYYPCAVAGAIDRVIGLDIGKKSLPEEKDPMKGSLTKLCRFCGRFKLGRACSQLSSAGNMSPFWEKAYFEFQAQKPQLTTY
jgi:hypothetical protein